MARPATVYGTTPPAEKAVQAQIVSLYRTLGFKVDSTSQYRASHITLGFPDLVVFADPLARFFFFEVKTYQRAGFALADPRTWRPKPLAPNQLDFRARCISCGVLHFWGGLPQAQQVLVEFGLGYFLPSGLFALGRRRS